MPQTMTAPTPVTSQYAAQVTADLEHNAKEQERISGDIAALQEQLAVLQHDHSVLLNVQQALGIVAAPAEPATAPDATTVPAPREEDTTGSDADESKPARAKRERGQQKTGTSTRARAAAKEQTPSKPAAQKPVGKASGVKGAGATLVELVRRHLAEQSEPRSAAEVTEALVQAHPERGIKSTVVRTTLENLVSRAQAQRSKQGSSVHYVAPDTNQQATTPTQDKPRPERAE